MSKVINLDQFRRKNRKAYLAKYSDRLDKLISTFVMTHIDTDFRQLASDFLTGKYGSNEEAWDYVDFRELLSEAIDQVFGDMLMDLIKTQHWYDRTMISRDEIIERSITAYVLGHQRVALVPSPWRK